MRKQGI